MRLLCCRAQFQHKNKNLHPHILHYFSDRMYPIFYDIVINIARGVAIFRMLCRNKRGRLFYSHCFFFDCRSVICCFIYALISTPTTEKAHLIAQTELAIEQTLLIKQMRESPDFKSAHADRVIAGLAGTASALSIAATRKNKRS
jgi:hypothetical protein